MIPRRTRTYSQGHSRVCALCQATVVSTICPRFPAEHPALTSHQPPGILSMGWRGKAAAREHGDHKQRRPGGNFYPSSRRGTQRPMQAAGIGAATSVLLIPAPSSHLTLHATASHLYHHVKSFQTGKRLPVYWETRDRDKICQNDKR